MTMSDYHRVFIFCDAEIVDGVWTPFGLNSINFQEETANSLLKTIEEPPSNTTFFFLTRDKNDLMSTIISRSQSFYVPNRHDINLGYSNVEKILADYFDIERQNVFSIADELTTISKEKGAENILAEVENYLLALLKSNIDNKKSKAKLLSDLKVAEAANLKLKSHIQPQLAFEEMLLTIIS